MEAAMAAHRAALDARRRSSGDSVEKPRDRDGGVRKRGLGSPRGSLGGASSGRPDSGAHQGRHVRYGDSSQAPACRQIGRSHAGDPEWEDYCFKPVVPMHLRRWKARSDTRPPAHSASTPVLTFVSYNMLAESLESNTTSGLASDIASFEARRKLLANELQAWNADVYCLQEVDHFNDFVVPLMDKLGLDGEFLQRRGDRQDGCAIFWRRDKLRLISSSPLHFDVSGQFDRPNVAQILEFEALHAGTAGEGRSAAKDSKRFLVANTHILFNPKRGDIKLQQVHMTLERLWQASGHGAKPIVYCGDFNSAPFSPMYDYLSSGLLVLDGLCPSLVSGQVAWDAAFSARAVPILRETRGGSGATLCSKTLARLQERGTRKREIVCRYFAQGWCRDSAACPYLHLPALGGRDPHLPRGKPAHECRAIWSSWFWHMHDVLARPEGVRRVGEFARDGVGIGAGGSDCCNKAGGRGAPREESGILTSGGDGGEDEAARDSSRGEEREEDASARPGSGGSVGRLRKKWKEGGREDLGTGQSSLEAERIGPSAQCTLHGEDMKKRECHGGHLAAGNSGHRGLEGRFSLQHGLQLSSVYCEPLDFGSPHGQSGGFKCRGGVAIPALARDT